MQRLTSVASNPAWGRSPNCRPAGSLVAGFATKSLMEGTKTTMDTAAEFGSTFGCGYCRDPRNRRSGKIDEVSRFAHTGTILLRCPQCSAHYVVNDDRTITTRITDSEAESLLKRVDTSGP